jgi:hypothetical protein
MLLTLAHIRAIMADLKFMARIGQILVTLGATTENNVARALGVQGFAGGRLGTLLLERGSVSEDDLGEALAQQHGRPYVPWTVLGEVSPDVVASLPAKFAIRHAAIPFERGENYLKIALRDPSDLRILDELFFVTGRKILPAVAPEARVYQALEKYYGERRTPRYAILGEKLSRPARRRSRGGPPPPPDFFPSGHSPVPSPEPHEVWGDAAESDGPPPPIIQRWKIPEEPATPWLRLPSRVDKSAPPVPEEDSITWEETPPPEMWLPESGASAPPKLEVTPPRAPERAAPVSLQKPAPSPAAAVAATTPAAEMPAAEALPPPPSETDFPDVLAAGSRDEIASAALASLSRRFDRSAFFVVRPQEVVGHSASGLGVNREAFRAVTIPWSEPSVFLNVRLARTFYLGPLPPLPSHRFLVEALGRQPDECLVQPVMMRDKPVAFLYAQFVGEKGATPMDLAYMRGLAAAAARAFAAAIRKKKKEPV